MPGRNVVSWTTMISGCAHGMQRANIGSDQVALLATLSACAELGDLKLGRSISQFLKANTGLNNLGPLRYCSIFDSYPASLSYVTRFHAKRILKFRETLLTSYHRNEHPVGSRENGAPIVHASGLIDINSAADRTGPTLPSSPKKSTLYHPSATRSIGIKIVVSVWGLAYGPHSC
ncbi:hypothetical protein U1Q18_032514, partial [Sarracenia purpurea var. burkii]